LIRSALPWKASTGTGRVGGSAGARTPPTAPTMDTVSAAAAAKRHDMRAPPDIPVIAAPPRRLVPLDQLGDKLAEELQVRLEIPLVSGAEALARLGEHDHRPGRVGEAGQPGQQRLAVSARSAPVQTEHKPRRRPLRLGQKVTARRAGDPYRAGAPLHGPTRVARWNVVAISLA
jgi:hypothetical protein